MSVYVKLIEVYYIVFYLCENEKEIVVDIGNKGVLLIKLFSRLYFENM